MHEDEVMYPRRIVELAKLLSDPRDIGIARTQRSAASQFGPFGTGAEVTVEAKRPTRADDRRLPAPRCGRRAMDDASLCVPARPISRRTVNNYPRSEGVCPVAGLLGCMAGPVRPGQANGVARHAHVQGLLRLSPRKCLHLCQGSGRNIGRACSRSTDRAGNMSATIELESWQQEIVDGHPGDFARGSSTPTDADLPTGYGVR